MTLTRKQPKPRKCKVCKELFTPHLPMAKVCSLECALSLAALQRCTAEKIHRELERQAVKAKLEGMRGKGWWVAEAQKAFNAYIRLRDAGKPCICCGLPLGEAANSVDAGHYRSRGSAPHLRFDERNVHSQRKQCNRYGFDITGYRNGLIARIGLEAVEALEADQAPKHYTVADLKAIRDEYRAKAKALKGGK